MNRFRTVAAGLISAAVMTVAACSGEDTTSTADQAPSATPTAASSSPAPSVAPTTTAVSSSPAVTTAADKAVCESVKKAGEEMKTQLIDVFKSGEQPTPAAYRKILTSLGARLTTLAATAGDGPVTTALRGFAAEATKAAAAADPATAAADPAFERTATAITAACKPTGVDANF